MFNPLTNNEKERRELINSSLPIKEIKKELDNSNSLLDFYHLSDKIKNGAVSQMTLFILDNYERLPLNIWNDNVFCITKHMTDEEYYFGKKDKPIKRKNKATNEILNTLQKQSHKIKSIRFTLDPTDGDFSVDFNNGYWSFLDDEDILHYYIIVKNYLKDEK